MAHTTGDWRLQLAAGATGVAGMGLITDGVLRAAKSERRIGRLVRRQDAIANDWLSRQRLPRIGALAKADIGDLQRAGTEALQWRTRSIHGVVSAYGGTRVPRDAYDTAMKVALRDVSGRSLEIGR